MADWVRKSRVFGSGRRDFRMEMRQGPPTVHFSTVWPILGPKDFPQSPGPRGPHFMGKLNLAPRGGQTVERPQPKEVVRQSAAGDALWLPYGSLVRPHGGWMCRFSNPGPHLGTLPLGCPEGFVLRISILAEAPAVPNG